MIDNQKIDFSSEMNLIRQELEIQYSNMSNESITEIKH
jgi:hypothetical protein